MGRQMAIKNTVSINFDLCSWIVIISIGVFFDCRLPGVKENISIALEHGKGLR